VQAVNIARCDLVFNSLSDDGCEIELFFGGHEQLIGVWFGSAWAYRNRYELSGENDSEEGLRTSFFKVENSEYLKWLNIQSLGYLAVAEKDLVHYVILSKQNRIDVIAYEAPIIRVIETN